MGTWIGVTPEPALGPRVQRFIHTGCLWNRGPDSDEWLTWFYVEPFTLTEKNGLCTNFSGPETVVCSNGIFNGFQVSNPGPRKVSV